MDSAAVAATRAAAREAPLGPATLFARGPFSGRAWRDVAFLAAGSAALAPFVALLATGLKSVLTLAFSLFLVALLFLPWLLIPASRAQRSRFWSLQGLDLEIVRPYPGRPSWAAYVTALRSGSARRQTLYHLVVAPVLALCGLAVALAWPTGLAMALLPAYVGRLASSTELRSAPWPYEVPVLAGCGVALIWLVPAVARIVVVLDGRAAARLLGPDRERELEQRVAGLTESRSAVVQAADAERRRI